MIIACYFEKRYGHNFAKYGKAICRPRSLVPLVLIRVIII